MKQLIDSLQSECKKLKKENAKHGNTEKTQKDVKKTKKKVGGLGDVLGNFAGAHEVRRASATLGFGDEAFGADKVHVSGVNPMAKAKAREGRRTGRRASGPSATGRAGPQRLS